jgi:serine protease AprX
MVFIRKGFFVVILFIAVSAGAQVNRYMVFFKDKAGISYSIGNPIEYLSEKAIARRISQDISITEQDLPVNNNYVQGLRTEGAQIFFKTRWLNGVLVQCDQSLLPTLQNLSYVDHIDLVAPGEKLLNSGRIKTGKQNKKGSTATATQNQLSILGIPAMHEAGNKGKGITIAVFDGGFDGVDIVQPFQDVFSQNRINTTLSYDFVYNTTNVFQYDDHGTAVLSVMTANVPDAFTGGAYEASFQLYVTEDVYTEYRIEEYNWLFAAERADSAGVDIIHSSLGYYDFDAPSMNYTKAQMDGKTAVVSRAAQYAADRGIVVVCSAGNEGFVPWKIITAPADAVDVIAVANVDAQGKRSLSSSSGPSADGRIKPDLAAMGTNVKIINSGGAISSSSGTSLSAPLITCLVAGVWERYPNLTNKELIDLLKKTASQANSPDNLIGYGIPNFKAVYNYQERIHQQNIFEIFPNRIIDTITISPIDPDSIQSCRAELVSSQGQILASEEISFSWLNRQYQTDLSRLAPGLYFIRIWLGPKRYVFKVVKV